MTRGSKTSTESNVAQKYAVQSGIALGPILFILAIVAIIAAAIAVGSSGFKGNLGNDAASVLASSLMQQADTIYEATQQVFIGNSCPITQINFANPILPDYTNTSAPADHSCDVFNGTSGGGANYPIPNAKWLDPSMSGPNRIWSMAYDVIHVHSLYRLRPSSVLYLGERLSDCLDTSLCTAKCMQGCCTESEYQLQHNHNEF